MHSDVENRTAKELLGWIAEDCGNPGAEQEILRRLRATPDAPTEEPVVKARFEDLSGADVADLLEHDFVPTPVLREAARRLRGATPDAPTEEQTPPIVQPSECMSEPDSGIGICPVCHVQVGEPHLMDRHDRAPTDEAPEREGGVELDGRHFAALDAAIVTCEGESLSADTDDRRTLYAHRARLLSEIDGWLSRRLRQPEPSPDQPESATPEPTEEPHHGED